MPTPASVPSCSSDHRDEIDGVLVVLPNFGDEKGVADTLKLAELNVPVLIQGYPGRSEAARRGTPARCVLRQDFGLQQSGSGRHQVLADRKARFASDVGQLSDRSRSISASLPRGEWPARRALGAVGARPGAFNTVRYSEKILERHGISVTTVDLSEILGKAGKLTRRRCGRQGQARRDSALRAGARRARGKTGADGQAWAWCSSRWMEANALMPRRFNAGPRCSRTSAATSAR